MSQLGHYQLGYIETLSHWNQTYGEYNSHAGQTYKFGICDVKGRIFKKFTMTYTADADGKNTLMD